METARRASISATSCGVETTTAPDRVIFWTRLSWMSPVPGGMSTISTSIGASALAQATSRDIWLKAEDAIGPRQIIGAPSSTIRPIDITFSPQASSGISFLSGPISGSAVRPVIRGTEGP